MRQGDEKMMASLIVLAGLALAVSMAVGAALAGPLPAHAAAASSSLAVQRVDTARFPQVRVDVALPPALAKAEGPSFEVRENGAEVRGLRAEARVKDGEPVYVVLALDVSGSMLGEPLEHAREAAGRFLAALGEGREAALVTFASEAALVRGFTSDAREISLALDGLEAGGETAVYDGLALAAKECASRKGRRVVVLLSDGGDTASVGSADGAVSALRAAGANAYAVALTSPEFDPSRLRAVAAQTGGRFIPVGDSARLEKLYEDLAREIQTRYVLTYRSTEPLTKDVDLDVRVEAAGTSMLASAVFANPLFAEESPSPSLRLPDRPRWEAPLSLAVAMLAGGLAVALLGHGAVSSLGSRPIALRQLHYYDQLLVANEAVSADCADAASLKSRMIDAVGQVAGRKGFTKALHLKLESAGLPLRAQEYIFSHIMAVIVAGLLAEAVFGQPLASALVVLAAALGPLALLEMAIARRRARFEAQLPDVLNLIAGSLRAGYGLMQAVGLVVSEAGEPAAAEFRRVQTEIRLGLPVKSALAKAAERVRSEDFSWTVTAIAVQREVGGNLAEVLDIVAETIRERDTLRRQVKALSAEGRLSAAILFVLPFVEVAVLLTVNPRYIGMMTSSGPGLVLVGIGVLLLLLGGVWLRSTVRIEV